MHRDTLSAKRRSLCPLIVGLLAFAPLACGESDTAGPDGGGPGDDPTVGTSITAGVVLSDVSQLTGGAPSVASASSLSGQLGLDGIGLELWDGEQWLQVTGAAATATVTLGDGTATALVPETEIPAGDYTRARLTASAATVDVTATLNGREISAQMQTAANRSVTIERDIQVTVNQDGSRTFRLELQTITSINLQSRAGEVGSDLVIGGDLGSLAGPGQMRAGVMARDVSDPLGAGVTGTVDFSGLMLELSDDGGTNWLTVTDQPTTAQLTLADGTVEATLMATDQIPAGDYDRARLTATEATVDVTASINGQDFSAQFKTPSNQPVVIVTDVEVVTNADGTVTLRIELQVIKTVTLEQQGAGMGLQIGGDLGTISAPATISAAVVASDISSPSISPAGANLSGTATFTGLTIELSQDDGQTWLKVAEESGSADVALADGTVDATLMPVDDIPAGLYTKVRLTADQVDLTVDLDGQQFAAQTSPAGGGTFVVEKDVEVIVNQDGTITIRVELEMIRTIELSVDPNTGEAIVIINGDIGTVQAAAV